MGAESSSYPITKDEDLEGLMAAASSSDRITKDEQDLEGGSILTCRICLQCNGLEDEDLISPCMCKGTQQLVHRACLDHWRSVKEGFDFSHCTTCKAQFHLRVVSLQSWSKTKFRLFVARDIFFVFLAVQTIIGGLGGLAYLVDKHGYLKELFNNSWDRILSRHPIPIYYCVGLIMFLVLVGFIGFILDCCCTDDHGDSSSCTCCVLCPDESPGGDFDLAIGLIILIIFLILGIAYGLFAAIFLIQRISQRHYHILAKRELTKEYVVEDLKGHYTPAQMDPEHMERLKTLKLM